MFQYPIKNSKKFQDFRILWLFKVEYRVFPISVDFWVERSVAPEGFALFPNKKCTSRYLIRISSLATARIP